MKRFIFSVILMFVGSMASACEINGYGDVDKVTVAKLKVMCEEAKIAAKNNVPSSIVNNMGTPEGVQQLSVVGRASLEISQAIVLAAREIGIAANDFLKTPAGILVAVAVFMKLFLTDVIALFGLLFSVTAVMWMVRRSMVSEYQNVEVKYFWGLFTRIKRVPMYSSVAYLSEEQQLTILLSCIAGTVIGAIFLMVLA